jgi:gamma-tubulin complex component 3
MLEYSQGEIGWDVFTLEYKVDAPLDTVLDPDSMIKYLKLFNHLWKMKRIENTVTKGWVRTASATKAFVRIPGRVLGILDRLATDVRNQSWNRSGTKSA